MSDQPIEKEFADADERRTASRDLAGLSSVGSMASIASAIPMFIQGKFKCRDCDALTQYPGICEQCGERIERQECERALRRAIRLEVPERYLWAAWDSPELARRVRGGEQRVRGARAALESNASVVVLIGPGRCGKTSLACAWVRQQITSRVGSIRFVSALGLTDDEAEHGRSLPMARAMAASHLVLDDLGAELAGAPIGSGLMAMRVEAVVRLVDARHNKNRPIVVTTAIGSDMQLQRDGRGLVDTRPLRRAVADRYGDNVAGRLFEGAAVVPVGMT